MGYEPEDLPWEVPLIELGLDSLMAVRIKNRVEYDFDLPPIQLTAVRDANLYAVEKLIEYAIEHRDEVEELPSTRRRRRRGDRRRAGRADGRRDDGRRTRSQAGRGRTSAAPSPRRQSGRRPTEIPQRRRSRRRRPIPSGRGQRRPQQRGQRWRRRC